MRRATMVIRLAVAVATAGLTACTAESTRVALATQRRADQIQQALFERQHDALRLLLYRDALHRLGATTTPEQRSTALNDIWNDRDLVEFWAVQNERCAALRLIGVDFKLHADQSMVDLLIKQIESRWQRAEEGLARAAGSAAGGE